MAFQLIESWSLIWSLAVALLLLACLWLNIPGFLVRYYRTCKALKHMPGWPTHWLWGNLHQVKADEATLFKMMNWARENDYRVSKFWVGPFICNISLNHCEQVRKVLKEPKLDRAYKLLVPWLGDGLLISEGEKWHRNRHLLTPAFHFEILKSYMSVYNSCLKVLIDKWSSSVSQNEPVKVFDTISLLSLDIVLQCAFSCESDCQNTHTKHPYIKAVYDVVDLITRRGLRHPVYRMDWLYALTHDGRRMKDVCKFLHEHSEKIIRERKKVLGLDKSDEGIDRDTTKVLESAAKQRKYLDFLDILLTAKDEEGNGLTDLEIRNEADTFMFEGHDTTTSGMSWTLYCLAKHPEHQEKVREEVRSVLMGREWLEYDDLKELKYTQWCIKEAMRLYPPVYNIFRKASEDLELYGYQIPKGTAIRIAINNIHRHPDTWPNPDEFDPLRFHPSNAEGRDPFAYMPFSAGHRNCIGQNFAMNEEKSVVASIVHRFALSLEEGQEVEMAPKVILKSKEDIQLRLEPLYT